MFIKLQKGFVKNHAYAFSDDTISRKYILKKKIVYRERDNVITISLKLC